MKMEPVARPPTRPPRFVRCNTLLGCVMLQLLCHSAYLLPSRAKSSRDSQCHLGRDAYALTVVVFAEQHIFEQRASELDRCCIPRSEVHVDVRLGRVIPEGVVHEASPVEINGSEFPASSVLHYSDYDLEIVPLSWCQVR